MAKFILLCASLLTVSLNARADIEEKFRSELLDVCLKTKSDFVCFERVNTATFLDRPYMERCLKTSAGSIYLSNKYGALPKVDPGYAAAGKIESKDVHHKTACISLGVNREYSQQGLDYCFKITNSGDYFLQGESWLQCLKATGKLVSSAPPVDCAIFESKLSRVRALLMRATLYNSTVRGWIDEVSESANCGPSGF